MKIVPPVYSGPLPQDVRVASNQGARVFIDERSGRRFTHIEALVEARRESSVVKPAGRAAESAIVRK